MGIELRLTALTAANFEPYGRVIVEPARPAAASGPGWQWWGEIERLEAGDRPYTLGFLSLRSAGLTFDWAERHQLSQELIVPLGGKCLIYVAAPTGSGASRAGPPADFRVFEVGPGSAVLLDKGVWHGAPLALNEPLNALVALLEGTGNEDTEVVELETIRVVPGTASGEREQDQL